MREKQQCYEQIRKVYPENISKEQFYQIAHISKATALYLLESGKVPCTKSEKRTHRYIIRTDDVIRFLKDRACHPDKYRVPDGWYYQHSGAKGKVYTFRSELSDLTIKQWGDLRVYIEKQTEEYDDLLSVSKVTEITGYSSTTIQRWCSKVGLKAFRSSRGLLIPKQCLVNFLTSAYICDLSRKSQKHRNMICDFLKTQV